MLVTVVPLTACSGDDAAASGAAGGSGVDPITAAILGDGMSYDEIDLAIAERTRDCMVALGWEYTAVASASLSGGAGAATADPDEFARTYGYGITTFSDPGDGTSDDPNAAYLGSLSPSDQTRYTTDLYGEAMLDAGSDGSNAPEFGGCYGEAIDVQFGDRFAQLMSAYDRLDDRIQADPRMVAANQAWSTCMNGRGFDLAAPSDAIALVEQRARQVLSSGVPSEGDIAALNAEEIQVAVADRACATDHIDPVIVDVRRDAEQAVLREGVGA
jgi:hypothetical protein